MGEADSYLNEAHDAYELRNYKSAIETATKAIEAGCTDKAAIQIRALSYYYTNQFSLSIADFTNYLEAAPEDFTMVMLRGLAYSFSEQPDKAVDDMSAFISAHPDKSNGYQNRGFLFLTMARYKEAINDLSKALQMDDTNGELYFHRGAAYYNIKKYSTAYEDFTRAAPLLPEHAELFYLRGLVLFFRKAYPRCIEDMSRVIFLDDKHPYARFYRMLSYSNTGKKTDAQYDADLMVRTHTAPFAFSKNGKNLPLVSMRVKKGGLDFGVDTSSLGAAEEAARNKWLQAGNKNPRPVPDVTISFKLPQGGTDDFQGKVVEEKW